MGRKAYIKQAAEETGLTEYQLRRMTKEGKVPFLLSGNRYIFDLDLLEEALRNEAMKNVKAEEPVEQYGILRKIQCD